MMKRLHRYPLFAALASAAIIVGGSAIASQHGGSGTGAAGVMLPADPMDFGPVYEQFAFEAADTDGNDLISEGEFVRDAAAGFAGLDANRDGKLSPAELGPHDPKRFARVDANKDGFLTFKEIMTYKMQAFSAADANNDGGVSFDEMVNSVKAELAR
jgi:hypothetical protein